MTADYKLFVRNMAPTVTDDALEAAFAQFGQVSFCRICVDQDSNQSRGFGFVCFTAEHEAKAALEALNSTELEGKAIEIKLVENNNNSSTSSNPLFQMECYAFKKGACKFGSQCRFSHNVQQQQQQPEQQQQQQQQEYFEQYSAPPPVVEEYVAPTQQQQPMEDVFQQQQQPEQQQYFEQQQQPEQQFFEQQPQSPSAAAAAAPAPAPAPAAAAPGKKKKKAKD